jgi:protease-4
MEIVNALDNAEKDPRVGAVLLEINSGGGTIVAARQITEKIKKVRQSKKVVAWISETGASAAYYIAASSDHIVADQDSITGSIGVVSVLPNLEGLFEKLGIKFTVLTEGKHKDMGSMFSELSEEDEMLIQSILHSSFVRFKQEIIDFRQGKLDLQAFNRVADGRILSGEQALEIGLIDEFGTKAAAINATARLAQIETPRVVDFGKKETSLIDLFSSAGYQLGSSFKQGVTDSRASIQS